MSSGNIRAEARSIPGSRASRRIRNAGSVPAVIYGHQQDPLHVAVPGRDFANLLKSKVHLFKLELDGKKPEQAIIKDVQYDPFGQQIMHIDFLRVDINEAVEVRVQIEFVGHPKGATEGGILEQFITNVPVRCTPDRIPDSVSVRVDHLGLHESVRMKEIQLPEGVALAGDPEVVICSCVERYVAPVAVAVEEAVAEPATVGAEGKEEGAKDEAAAGKGGAKKEEPAKGKKEDAKPAKESKDKK
jgi:large subunit ribosomal protein L25